MSSSTPKACSPSLHDLTALLLGSGLGEGCPAKQPSEQPHSATPTGTSHSTSWALPRPGSSVIHPAPSLTPTLQFSQCQVQPTTTRTPGWEGRCHSASPSLWNLSRLAPFLQPTAVLKTMVPNKPSCSPGDTGVDGLEMFLTVTSEEGLLLASSRSREQGCC